MKTEEELWKPVLGYEGLYSVSNLGRIRSEPRILASRAITGNYLQIHLCKGKKRFKGHVHRVVAMNWLPFDGVRRHVNHKNGDKKDNRAANLEWVTPKENAWHAKINGFLPRGDEHYRSKLSETEVAAIRSAAEADPKINRTELAKVFGVSSTTIRNVIKRIRHVSQFQPVAPR